MMFKFLPKVHKDDHQTYARIDDDGKCRLTCTADYPEFQAWLAEGNVPTPAEEPTQTPPSEG
jgi:hypothetical protein